RNDLIARQYDSLNQPSPDSDTLTVFYTQASAPFLDNSHNNQEAIARFQLVVDYDQTVQSIFKGQAFRLPIRFNGGMAPYAVAVDWGDGETSLFSRTDAAAFIAEHTYEIEGYKTIIIKISDSAGGQAALQLVVLVQGASDKPGIAPIKTVLGAPLSTMAVSVGISVALGFVGGLLFALWVWVFKK
ncbi:MAG TPA: hypothetical protein VFT87_00815, partial [Candidatus Saccharimonadales bacterium]|nr:hypothetical protein [Candidatus Saccharimonadales bacterium]